MPALVSLKSNQKTTIDANPKDASGNVAFVLPGTLGNTGIIWSVSPSTFLTIVPGVEGANAVVSAKGPVGESTITLHGTSESGVAKESTFTVSVIAGELDHFVPTASTPVAQ